MKYSRFFSAAATLSLLASSFVPAMTSAATHTGSVFNSGDLIKAPGQSTVYYFGADGKRYIFPNSKTYFTWYTDFSNVKLISDGQLSTMPLGKNVTYRPGRKMVKITTVPSVYVVDQGGILRHVATEQLAETLYGISWRNQIDDVPDSYFSNYRIGTPIQTASDYQPGNVMTLTANINQDKQLSETKITVSIGSINNGFVPGSTTVKRGTEVTWTNNDVTRHTVTGTGFDSGWLEPGASYTHRFNTVGSFDYRCSIHPVMQGTINVVN